LTPFSSFYQSFLQTSNLFRLQQTPYSPLILPTFLCELDLLTSNEMQNGNYTVEYMLKLDDDKIFIRLRFNGRVFDIEFGPEDLHDSVNTTDSQPFKQQYLDALQHLFSDDEAEEAAEADEVDEATEFSELRGHFDTAVSPISSECGCEEDPVIKLCRGTIFDTWDLRNFRPGIINTLSQYLTRRPSPSTSIVQYMYSRRKSSTDQSVSRGILAVDCFCLFVSFLLPSLHVPYLISQPSSRQQALSALFRPPY
jgi:hypothetical protein